MATESQSTLYKMVDEARRYAKRDLIAQLQVYAKMVKETGLTMESRIEEYIDHKLTEQELVEQVMQDLVSTWVELRLDQIVQKQVAVELAKAQLTLVGEMEKKSE